MVRKWPAVDIMKLYSGKLEGFNEEIEYLPQQFNGDDLDAKIDASKSYRAIKSHHKWNAWLRKCLRNNDLDDLIKVRYGLQVGMDDLYKAGLSTPQITEMFIRWTKSIERTAREIIKRRYKMNSKILSEYEKAAKEKRVIDIQFERFLRESSF